jgi:hypothetical protein
MMGAAAVWLGLNAALFVTAAPLSVERVLPGQARNWTVRDLGKPVLAMGSACAAMRAIFCLIPASDAAVLCYLGLTAAATALAGGLAAPAAREMWRRMVSLA